MLTEEAHHMFVGQTGLGRVIERTCQLMRDGKGRDVSALGGIPLEIIQRYVNFWSSSSNDLFGGEISSNASNFFGAGLKGRANEEKLDGDHQALEGTYAMEVLENGALRSKDVPLRNAMNEVLRDEYVSDNEKGIEYFNKICEKSGVEFRFTLPHRRFNRRIGMFAEARFDPAGACIDEATWNRRVGDWLPTEPERELVKSLMVPCHARGQMAGWIAPPAKGIDGKPFDWEYVRL
jgi:benzoyl-CoA 2,3-dioxygenase component B